MSTPIASALDTELQQYTYLSNKQHSDITIVLTDREIHAHRFVLVLSSKFFKAALEGQKASSKIFNMPDDDPEAVVGMLSYFYGLDPHSSMGGPGGYLNLKLLAIAGKYDVLGLLEDARDRVQRFLFYRVLEPDFNSVVEDVFENEMDHGGGSRR
ncbi:hypothetical protein LTR78_003158 [Recurvomyces mirabilis]|uniref:BTB domain-containing protein n=1 Tax=Recurvomyces mirabilis TaxID=574656 RepID=A0AAE1C3N6_9PEZI|nr:hypothetical protein LTR78_003158 [Recurvomyces mirabilis]KAK5157022.1 hypothetical protein LTS14_004539 [Recurvomyces mirabilis]